jgi:hypothetical protein
VARFHLSAVGALKDAWRSWELLNLRDERSREVGPCVLLEAREGSGSLTVRLVSRRESTVEIIFCRDIISRWPCGGKKLALTVDFGIACVNTVVSPHHNLSVQLLGIS